MKNAIKGIVERRKMWKLKALEGSSEHNASILQQVIVHTALVVLGNRTSRLMVVLAKLLRSPKDLKV